MKYLKTYEAQKNIMIDKISQEALSLGFTPIPNSDIKFRLKINNSHSLTIYITAFHIENNLTGREIYVDSLVKPEIDLYLSFSPVERAIKLVNYIIDQDTLGKSIDDNLELKDMLTNFLDKGYYLKGKEWGFLNEDKNGLMNCDHRMSNTIPFAHPFIKLKIEWRYILDIELLEDQSHKKIHEDFGIFRSYLKMEGLKAELVVHDKLKRILILINKI